MRLNKSNQHWLAWQDGKTVKEMQKVVWETQKEKGYEKGIARWREIGNPSNFWDPIERIFKPVKIIQ
ncbi:MAG: hypothetical protein Q8P68_02815 [Candidatus Peregrinibacteria bacterium]|nr:hypothetical protein [Candidatus Peregrinibacteria bacterium]